MLGVMNALFSLIFLIDFTYRIFTAPSAAAYFFRHFGWADLLASLPFPQLKILRIFRLIRVYRLLKDVGLRAISHAHQGPRRQRAVRPAAHGHLRAAVRQPRDARARAGRGGREHHHCVRRALVHDRHDLDRRLRRPISGHSSGRLCGTAIIVVGVGIFGTFTGYLATVFLSPKEDAAAAADATGEQLSSASVETLRTLLAESEAKMAQIKRLLN